MRNAKSFADEVQKRLSNKQEFYLTDEVAEAEISPDFSEIIHGGRLFCFLDRNDFRAITVTEREVEEYIEEFDNKAVAAFVEIHLN